jgi:hypothetical protein
MLLFVFLWLAIEKIERKGQEVKKKRERERKMRGRDKNRVEIRNESTNLAQI